MRGAAAAEAQAAYDEAVQVLDRAGRKRLIHPNAAARQKSRLAKLVKTRPRSSRVQAENGKGLATARPFSFRAAISIDT